MDEIEPGVMDVSLGMLAYPMDTCEWGRTATTVSTRLWPLAESSPADHGETKAG